MRFVELPRKKAHYSYDLQGILGVIASGMSGPFRFAILGCAGACVFPLAIAVSIGSVDRFDMQSRV